MDDLEPHEVVPYRSEAVATGLVMNDIAAVLKLLELGDFDPTRAIGAELVDDITTKHIAGSDLNYFDMAPQGGPQAVGGERGLCLFIGANNPRCREMTVWFD